MVQGRITRLCEPPGEPGGANFAVVQVDTRSLGKNPVRVPVAVHGEVLGIRNLAIRLRLFSRE
jgi:hypothetical protein